MTSGEGYEAKLLQGQVQGSGVVAQITGADGQAITDRDIAQGLRGAAVQVDKSDLPKLPQGEHYWMDLMGLEVRSTEGVSLGKVTNMTSNGAQDVLVVTDGERERLIPFVSGPIVKSVDRDEGRIVCDWHPDY